jgi:hypothetical protein
MSGCSLICPEQPVLNGCETFELIYPSRQDTAETKKQILAHNKKHEQVCE